MVGLLGRVISSSQGLYLHRTTQHRKTRTNIHALSGIRTRDPLHKRSRPAPQTVRPLDRLSDELITFIYPFQFSISVVLTCNDSSSFILNIYQNIAPVTAQYAVSLVLDICTEIYRANFAYLLYHTDWILDSTTTVQHYKRRTQQMFAHDRRSHRVVITFFKTLRVCI
jgi:hypothetical protein